MSEQVHEAFPDIDGVLADPARLLAADRAGLRARIGEASAGVGREVFLQAEAMFGVASVPRAEFASWLRFAALAVGEREYADRVTSAEPGMPWRTVWAWWRPANWFVASPSLNGDYYDVKVFEHAGRELVRVRNHWSVVWLDKATGRRVPEPDGDVAEGGWGSADGPVDLWDLELTAPESWAESWAFAAEDGRTRYVWECEHGLAVFETDEQVLRDWPRGTVDCDPSDEIPDGPEPTVRRPEGPLTARELDDVYGENVLRVPEEELPELLQHPGSRRHLRDVGVFRRWTGPSGQYQGHGAGAMTPPAAEELSGTDLLTLGTCDYGDVFLHRREGSVHVLTRLDGVPGRTLVTIAPDLEVFTRTLEAVHRYSNACWHPYPTEVDQEFVRDHHFLDELDERSPGLFDRATPAGEFWSWMYAGITELGVDGY
ncbi:SUKH-4 family immunity protein [Streptomyces sp. Da 82-17]|uniref:SUKH-4 family immunity protein n=1 Tax=Streptomyces sp. Da 82-17 TaxID=3377116 RepID=UPI0038D50671